MQPHACSMPVFVGESCDDRYSLLIFLVIVMCTVCLVLHEPYEHLFMYHIITSLLLISSTSQIFPLFQYYFLYATIIMVQMSEQEYVHDGYRDGSATVVLELQCFYHLHVHPLPPLTPGHLCLLLRFSSLLQRCAVCSPVLYMCSARVQQVTS